MTSLTLKGIPELLINRLRARAKQERRSLNQQAIILLEQALEAERPDFRAAHDAYVNKYGPPPFDDAFFEGLRGTGPERPLPFSVVEDEA